jgi:hypothetical protein
LGDAAFEGKRAFPLYRRDPLSNVVEMMLEAKIERNPYGENVAEKMLHLIMKITQ